MKRGSCQELGPKAPPGAIELILAPGHWNQPVPLARADKYPSPSPSQAAMNSLFMVAEWGEGRRFFAFFEKRLVIFLYNLAINF